MAGIRTACDQVGLNGVGASAPIKMDPTRSSGYFGSKTATPPYQDACTYGRASHSGLSVAKFVSGLAKDDVGDGGTLPEDGKVVGPYTNTSTDKTAKHDAKVTKLTNALQSIKGTDSVSCLYYPAGGGTKDSKSQKASERGKYKMMMQAYQSPTLSTAPFFEAYLAEPGVDPVDSNGVVNASQIIFAGFGVTSLAQLEMRQIKDETKGDKAFKTYYLASMWNRPETEKVVGSDGYAKLNQNQMVMGFWFTSFLVQKITIRNKNFGEIYAEIGGIWGASLAVLALLFVKSGTRNKKGKEAYIFKYYPGSVKKQVLNAFTAANDVPYTAAEGLELKTSSTKPVSPA